MDNQLIAKLNPEIMRDLILILSGISIFLITLSACGGDDSSSGNCSISCGGFGTGQPFVQTNHPFVSEGECIQLGMDRGGGCKASYCPPTGDPDDCYQVYP